MSDAPALPQEMVDQFVGAAHADLAAIQELLEREPSLIGATSRWGETALAAAAHSGQAPIVEYLVARGAPLDVFAAAVLGRADRVAEFLDANPELVHATGSHGIPLLFYPALAGHPAICRLLLARGTDVNAGAGRITALHGAVSAGQPETVALLVAAGADVNAASMQGKTPLAAAADAGRADLVELMRRHGAAS